MSFDRQLTVAQLVLEHPVTAQVFKSHKIDFCCRGKVTVDVAARERGIEPELVIGELDRAIDDRSATNPGQEEQLGALSTQALIERIVSRHHGYLRRILPFLRGLSIKVARVHGDKNPKLLELNRALHELDESLIAHLDEEETALFPYLASGGSDPQRTEADLDDMHAEHLQVGELLRQIRAAADEFSLPSWACASYRALMSELEAMESDLFRHIHLETHVLSPRFVSAAAAR